MRDVLVTDLFGAAKDPQLPTVALALDPELVNEEFHHGLPRLAGKHNRVSVRSITVIRHKPGRRCVIEYNVRVRSPDGSRKKAILIAKIRARRFGNEAYRLLDHIWNSGFDDHAPDRVSVPEPVAVIPRFQMWLQRKAAGTVSSLLLPEADGISLACRVAEAIHKLHGIDAATDRVHAMTDELNILRECLAGVAAQKPASAKRINRILNACIQLAGTVPEPKRCGIHRDFYPAQVIVDGSRLHLIDFDLYCIGDPALDVGNFIGHITEQSLRELRNPSALRDREEALEERFVALSGKKLRSAVRIYTTLTLARHIYLSTQFPERMSFTEKFMELCEERLGLTHLVTKKFRSAADG